MTTSPSNSRAETPYQAAVAEIERDLGWTEEDASHCGCNYREDPCDRCWSLGWRIGGINLPPPTTPPTEAKGAGEGV